MENGGGEGDDESDTFACNYRGTEAGLVLSKINNASCPTSRTDHVGPNYYK